MRRRPSSWLAHTPMTAPGTLAGLFKGLPTAVPDLNRVVQGLLIDHQWLGYYGVHPTLFGPLSRDTIPVEKRISSVMARDGWALPTARGPAHRALGKCRDFALLLCSFLRATGTPARLRCGFANYFHAGWEDHWVCEYWDQHAERWCLSDAQLDETIRAACSVRFNPADMPRDAFLTAGEAWLRCRGGVDDPGQFGHADTTGLWFMKVNLARDALAVNDRVTSNWDGWRDVRAVQRIVAKDELGVLDRLACDPEHEPVEVCLE